MEKWQFETRELLSVGELELHLICVALDFNVLLVGTEYYDELAATLENCETRGLHSDYENGTVGWLFDSLDLWSQHSLSKPTEGDKRVQSVANEPLNSAPGRAIVNLVCSAYCASQYSADYPLIDWEKTRQQAACFVTA